MGNYAISTASRTPVVVVGGNVSGDDVSEGIHWRLLGLERVQVLEKKTLLNT